MNGMSGIQPPIVACLARSFTRTTATCCRSDFDGADSAAASATLRTSSGTGAAV